MSPSSILFVSLLQVVHSTVYVMNNGLFSVIVSSFEDAVSQFGPELFHVDGFLLIANPRNACSKLQPVSNRTSWGNSSSAKSDDVSNLPFVALIQRGACHFDTKIFNAQMAGYSAAIVYNNVDNVIFPMKGNTVSDQVIIPSVMVDRSSGEQLELYACSNDERKFLVSVVSFYSLPLKYVLLSLLVLVGISLLVLIGCFTAHLCNLLRRLRRGRLSKRHLRRLEIKHFVKGQDPYETCPICLEDYKEREKLRLLPCHHAFHLECIDPWLLRNRRRCPVCNRTVDLPDAPRAFSDEDIQSSGEERVQSLNGPLVRIRRLVLLLRGRSTGPSSQRLPSTESINNLFDEDNQESAPLLSHIETEEPANSGAETLLSQHFRLTTQTTNSGHSSIHPHSVDDDRLLDLENETVEPHVILPSTSFKKSSVAPFDVSKETLVTLDTDGVQSQSENTDARLLTD